MILHTDRRRFVLGTLAGLAGLTRAASAGGARIRSSTGRTLVLVQLTGGNDGLSTLVPVDDDAYASVRSSTRVEARELLRLDERVGLHPGLKRLHTLHGEGGLALFEGVGYPQPNRSHFRSRDIWHAADPRGRLLGEGWVGRLLGMLEDVPVEAVVHVGANAPFALFSRSRPPLTLSGMGSDALEPGGLAGMEPESEDPASSLDYVRRAARDARSAATVFRGALDRYRRPADYSGSAFCDDLASAAALIHADVGVRVVSVELGGFDTHSRQREPHDRLMDVLDRGLAAFARDLQRSERGRETVVLAFSEFGRRLAENGSDGTDHGKAGLALALGGRVRGGLFGAAPDLANLEDGDPVFTTDFRSLYAAVIDDTFGVEPERLLGASFPVQPWLG